VDCTELVIEYSLCPHALRARDSSVQSNSYLESAELVVGDVLKPDLSAVIGDSIGVTLCYCNPVLIQLDRIRRGFG